jgi:uncharacterized membrane protein
MNEIEVEKRGIKRVIKIQIIVLTIIITVGGISYGIETGNWSAAFVTAIILQSIALLFGPMTYAVAVNRLVKFSDRID